MKYYTDLLLNLALIATLGLLLGLALGHWLTSW